MRSRFASLAPAQSALLEVALLFLPAIPAYLWLWPAVIGSDWLLPIQSLVYVYFFVGALFIGLRRWSWDELGVNRHGIWLSLGCGLALLAGRNLVLFSTNLAQRIAPLTMRQLLLDLVFYFALVGLVEELLFRGLVYRALLDWRGIRWAICGSALAFGFYHIGASGLAGIAGGLIIGVIFGLIRWRAGGILGLIAVHGLIDLVSVTINPQINSQLTTEVEILQPGLLALGYGLLLALVVYLWKMPAWKTT